MLEDEIKKTLNKIMSKLDKLDNVWNEVHKLRILLESREKLIPKFVENSPAVRTYRDMIYELFEPKHMPFDRDIYIMGYFDQQMLDKLKPMARYIKIITPSKALETKRNRDALQRISDEGGEVRKHDMLHARIFCVPDLNFLIIGSGDLDSVSMGGRHFDAGVWSNYSELTESAIHFFLRVWVESEPLR